MNHPPMNPALFKVRRERLGLSTVQLAVLLRVSDRTVRYWEDEKYAIPPGVAGELDRFEKDAAVLADALVRTWAGQRDPVLAVYRSDEDYREADPRGSMPASWHRAAVARALDRLPGATVTYAEPVAAPVVPALSIFLFCQLLDALNGAVIDDAAQEDPRSFLLGEIEDTLDDEDRKPAYPDLLDTARAWTPSQCGGLLAAVLKYRTALRAGGDHAAGLRAAGYPEEEA